ncbi:MAG: hypothetical protein ACK5BV_04735 [Bacteroidota bacterium]|jgi:hypothetical protein
MKTIHSVFFVISFLLINSSSFALSPWPEVSMPKWEIKEQRLSVSWTADSDLSDIVYYIEKSHDGKHFTPTGIVLGGFQNNHQFEFSYRLKYESGMHYRIKQVNKDGAARVVDLKSF